jgi:hypothetical protein
MPEISQADLNRLTQAGEDAARLTREMNELRISSVPPADRPNYQAQLNMDAEREALAAERAQLNTAARAVHAGELQNKTGIEASEFLKAESLAQMDAMAVDGLSKAFTDPKLRDQMDIIMGNTTTKTGTEGKTKPSAPGAETTPAGGQQPSEGGGQTPGENPGAKIAKDLAGTGDLEEMMRRQQAEVPWETVALGVEPVAVPAPQIAQPPAPSEQQTDGENQLTTKEEVATPA